MKKIIIGFLVLTSLAAFSGECSYKIKRSSRALIDFYSVIYGDERNVKNLEECIQQIRYSVSERNFAKGTADRVLYKYQTGGIVVKGFMKIDRINTTDFRTENL